MRASAAGSGTGTIVNDDDSIPPILTKKTPKANATGIPVAANPTVTFSEPADGVSNATFTLTNGSGSPVPAAVTYDATTRVATLNPTANLAADTRYTATLNGGELAIRDAAGNVLAPTTWTFLTGPKPGITAESPASGATGVSLTPM